MTKCESSVPFSPEKLTSTSFKIIYQKDHFEFLVFQLLNTIIVISMMTPFYHDGRLESPMDTLILRGCIRCHDQNRRRSYGERHWLCEASAMKGISAS